MAEGLAYLQSLEYHGILGSVPGISSDGLWTLPPGISVEDAKWGTLNVEGAKWKDALADLARVTAERDELQAMCASYREDIAKHVASIFGLENEKLRARLAELEAALTWSTWIGSGTPARGLTEERYREVVAEAAANHRARQAHAALAAREPVEGRDFQRMPESDLQAALRASVGAAADLDRARAERDRALREVDEDRRARLELERVRGILDELATTITELGVRPLRTAQKLQDLVKAAKQPGYRWCHLCDCAPCLCPPKAVSLQPGVEQELQAAESGEAVPS